MTKSSLTVLLVSLFLYGCTGSENDPFPELGTPTGTVWDDSSERLEIEVSNGLDLGSPYLYNRDRDTLPTEAKTLLFNLTTTTGSLSCGTAMDWANYIMTITDNTGQEVRYLNAGNAGCGVEGDPLEYILDEDLRILVSMLQAQEGTQ